MFAGSPGHPFGLGLVAEKPPRPAATPVAPPPPAPMTVKRAARKTVPWVILGGSALAGGVIAYRRNRGSIGWTVAGVAIGAAVGFTPAALASFFMGS